MKASKAISVSLALFCATLLGKTGQAQEAFGYHLGGTFNPDSETGENIGIDVLPVDGIFFDFKLYRVYLAENSDRICRISGWSSLSDMSICRGELANLKEAVQQKYDFEFDPLEATEADPDFGFAHTLHTADAPENNPVILIECRSWPDGTARLTFDLWGRCSEAG